MSDLHWGLEFTHPGWLAAVVAVPWVLWYFRRSLVDFARWQRAISTGVRVAIVLLLVLALAGLTLLRPTARQFVIVAIDQSLSVGEELVPGVVDANAPKKDSASDRYLDELLAAKVIGPDDRVAFVPFGSRPGAVSKERPKNGTKNEERRTGNEERVVQPDGYADGTDIAAAIEAAAAAMPPDYVPRIVLLTDGNQTRGGCLAGGAGDGQSRAAARGDSDHDRPAADAR